MDLKIELGSILIHHFSQINRKIYKPQDVGLSVWMLKV